MRLRRTALTAAVFVTLASLGLAQSGAKGAHPMAGKSTMSPAMMKPSSEMSTFAPLAGTWHCTGKGFASDMGPAHPTEATVTAKMDLGGHWFVSHYRESRTANNPMPIDSDEFWGYDGATKTYEKVVVEGMGGWAQGTAKAWQGTDLAWETNAAMMGHSMKTRETFSKKSDHEVVYRGSMQGTDGKWTDLWETTCKK